jgi:Skp family chaperone for outer membrane proteins
MSEENNTEELVDYHGKRIYPEVAEYFRTAAESELVHREAYADAEHAYNKAYRRLEHETQISGRRFDTYSDPDRAAVRALRDTRTAAFAEADRVVQTESPRALLLQSPHREVKWIAENVLFNDRDGEETGHAKTILRNLPMTQEELWKLAKEDRGMCNVFDRYFDRAEAAGVFSGGHKQAGARELAALRNYIRRNYGGDYMSRFMEQIEPLMKALRADADTKVAEAKAEWQKQDEAYAEQTHRNRSDGARRAAETRRRNAEAEAVAEAPQTMSRLSVDAAGNPVVIPVDATTGVEVKEEELTSR